MPVAPALLVMILLVGCGLIWPRTRKEMRHRVLRHLLQRPEGDYVLIAVSENNPASLWLARHVLIDLENKRLVTSRRAERDQESERWYRLTPSGFEVARIECAYDT